MYIITFLLKVMIKVYRYNLTIRAFGQNRNTIYKYESVLMIIRKMFKFENAHIVRGCSTQRCSKSIHGHSYKLELLLESNFLDNGQMIYDFGLLKLSIKDLIDSFDHAISLWSKDDKEYIDYAKKFSDRWVELPVSPSAEQLSRVFFLIIDKLLNQINTINGENGVSLHSIIVHETDTGYAQCFKEDTYNENMGSIALENIIFSEAIQKDWANNNLWSELLQGKHFTNPKEV